MKIDPGSWKEPVVFVSFNRPNVVKSRYSVQLVLGSYNISICTYERTERASDERVSAPLSERAIIVLRYRLIGVSWDPTGCIKKDLYPLQI